MCHFISLIIFLLAIPGFAFSVCDYEKVLRLAEQAKPSVLFAKEDQWSKSYQEKEKKAWEYLPNYTKNSEEEGIKAFAFDVLCVQDQAISLKKIHSSIRGTGLSGSSVYKVLDDSGQPLMIIKAIPFHEGSFLKEIAGLNLIASLSLQRLKTATILGMGYLEHGDQSKSYLIAESIAAGKNLDDYLIKMVMMSRISVPRTVAFEESKEMFFHFGRSLGELHGAKEKDFSALHPILLDYCNHTFYKGLAALQENLKLTELCQMLEKNYAFLRDYMLNPGVRYCFMHGDAQFANYFYDKESSLITIIDLPDSSLSMAQSLSPIGCGGYDYAKILEHLEMRTLFGMTDEEMHFLKLSFLQGYMASGRLPPADYQLAFFELVHDMSFMAHYFEGAQDRAWTLSFAIERIFKAKLKKMEKR